MDKYNEIWDKIKGKLSITFHSKPLYDEQYIKAKVREFNNSMVWLKQTFQVMKYQKEDMHYTCIACITIDSVIRMDKKNYPQVYLEECIRIKKIQMSSFINAELESDSDLELNSEAESEYDTVS